VACEEGNRVHKGALLATMEVPDLNSRIAQKRAEIEEAQAKLKLLEAGPRREAIIEERQRVQRYESLRDLAETDLGRIRSALKLELQQLEELIKQDQIELKYAGDNYQRTKEGFEQAVMSRVEFDLAEKKVLLCEAILDQHRARQRERVELGTTIAEAELARRTKDLADAKGILVLLEAGTRPEEISSQKAIVNRLCEELKYLQQVEQRSPVRAEVGGLMITPRLAEKVGQYFREGDLICTIEESQVLQAEIALPEQEMLRVRQGQKVELKFPASPYKKITGGVERIAPSATTAEINSTVTIYCNLNETPSELRPGLSGYARICCGKRPIAMVVGERIMRSLRTEYWW
jgi:HlyD family secretion protein